MLDVLLLLAVTRRLLESLDDEGRGGGNDGDSGLTVLNRKLDGDTETFLCGVLDGRHFTNPIRDEEEKFIHVPSRQWPWRYLHRPSWGRDQEDRSWERGRRRHQLHHRWHGGGYRLLLESSQLLNCKGSATNLHDLNLGGIDFGSCRKVELATAIEPADQKDDTHAWLVREVVGLF